MQNRRRHPRLAATLAATYLGLLLTAAGGASALAAPPYTPTACTTRVQHQLPHAICGFVSVPLDHARPSGPHTSVYFEYYPRTDTAQPALSTVLSIEGGPGFSTTADRWPRIAMWRPVDAHRNLLLVDLRGTGRSAPLHCAAFARHLVGYAARAAVCARQLGSDRVWFDTSQSVQDLESVLSALGAGKVDLYGDSYGSFAAQAFAVRHPWRLRSVVLDSTYPLPGSDPDWADLALATRLAIVRACERAPDCPVAPDRAIALVAGFVKQVATHPISGTASDGDGDDPHVVVDPDTMVQTLQDGFAYIGVYRDLLAAIRSAQAGDDEPILRLVAENETVDGGNGPVRQWSEALYLSVTCHDYPQPWPVGTPIDQRQAAAARHLATYPAGAFAPFSGYQWTHTDYEGVLACADWPGSPSPSDPPVPAGAHYPDVPTLILSGDMDNITPTADAEIVASRFPDSTLVVLPNSIHVVAEEDQNDCGFPIYLHFVETLHAGNTSCTAAIAPVRVVSRFPLSLAQVTAASAAASNRVGVTGRELAAATAETVADTIQRWYDNSSGTDLGLRGGSWSATGWNPAGQSHIVFTLHRLAFVPGVPVSGTVHWWYNRGPVTARVTVTAPGGLHATIDLAWSMQGAAARATLTGTVNGRRLAAGMLAP